MKKTLDIGEVVKASGLSPSAIRYYEEIGIIRSTGRKGLRRLFDATVLEHLEFIALGRQAGFSLQEIAAMFSKDGKFKIDRKNLERKALELEKNAKRLAAVALSLKHAAKCPAPNHFECPKFQRLLKVAGKYQIRTRSK